ncbi:glycosyl hydrolase [Salinarchaeum laminariae]|uniref:glycosyl hydrolase n=1 Tax=Salinarchaeum laminariae TaxID=869888 RepID=UPI0020BDC274|nr:glycosyl hydrolase [Salinarchaeum laminariae]
MSGHLDGRRGASIAVVLGVALLAVAVLAVPAAGVLGSIGASAGAVDPATANTSGASSPAQATLSVAIGQEARGNIFLTNETPRITLHADGEIAWRVEDYYGEVVANGTESIDGQTTIDFPLDEVGHYTLRVLPAAGTANGDGAAADSGLSDAADRPTIARTSLAVLPADEFDTDDEFYAMSTKFGAGRDHEMMDTLEHIGVGTVRDEHGWHDVEQSPGEYDFSGSDRAEFMAELQQRGFDRLFLLVYANQLYAEEWDGIFTFPSTEAAREGYANYTAAVLEEYPDLEHVEVWNEPNIESFSVGPAGQDPAAYAALLESTYDAVQKTRSDVTVVGGSTTRNYSTSGVPPAIDFGYWEGIFEAGGAEHMDAISVHLYRDEPAAFGSDLDQLRELTREYNDGESMPIWVTELGWATSPHLAGGDGETTQARHLVQSHAHLQQAGVERYYWYTQVDTYYQDDIWQHADGSDQFGLLRGGDNPLGENTPKPSYLAYATMTRQLADAEFQSSATQPVQRYRFADGDEQTSVLWTEERTDVTLRTDEPVTISTMTGDEQTLTPVDGEVYLTVGPDPIYVGGGIDEIEAGAPVGLQSSVQSGGSAGQLDATFENDGSVDRTLTHEIAGETLSLTAGGGETASGTMAVPDAYGNRAAVAVDTLRIDGEVVGRLEAPVGVPRAQFSEPAVATGMTVETINEGQWNGFSEVNDVGTDHSAFTATTWKGVACYQTDVDAGAPGHTLYVDLSDDHFSGTDTGAAVTVRYYDDGNGSFGIEYDGGVSEIVELDGDDAWETHTFDLSEVNFSAADGGLTTHGGHDFRISLQGSLIGTSEGDLCFESITMGTEPATSIDPVEGGGSGGNGTAGNGTAGNATDGSGGDGTPGFGLVPALLALLVAGLCSRGWHRRVD